MEGKFLYCFIVLSFYSFCTLLIAPLGNYFSALDPSSTKNLLAKKRSGQPVSSGRGALRGSVRYFDINTVGDEDRTSNQLFGYWMDALT